MDRYFSDKANEDYQEWRKTDKKIFKKINDLIEAAMVMAKHSNIEYKMYAASAIMKSRILEPGTITMKYPE